MIDMRFSFFLPISSLLTLRGTLSVKSESDDVSSLISEAPFNKAMGYSTSKAELFLVFMYSNYFPENLFSNFSIAENYS